MEERKERNKTISEKQLMEPFDVLKLGSKDDPCFSKLWDPKNEICQICGDIEACGIAFSQRTRKIEAAIESEQEFLDLKEVNSREKQILKFINKRVDSYEEDKLVTLIIKRFKITKQQAITLINK